ncbi:MAG TPA: gliding motility-associated C-terminal domain-containing protein, partial [Bacteroidia bacterium]|nr:gliding motility-associated C-terminal domain-containing protein [Bacteroidia bacterium]
TQYILMAYSGACRDSDTVTVSIVPAAIANAGASQSIFFGQTATIGDSPPNPAGGTITWMPNIYLSDTAASNPVASPTTTTTYTLFVTNSLGCIATDTMIVTVLPPFNINNGFTPNGDGKNDTWVIDELYKFPNAEIEIYNRWGEQLFYSKGAYTPWNGTYKGSPVPVGTYYYVIRLNDKNFPDHYAGPLTILR